MDLLHLEYCFTLTFLMSLIQNIGCKNAEYNIYTPREVSVQNGLCVHIPCTFTVPSNIQLSKEAKGYWCRSDGNTCKANERVAASDGSPVSVAARGRFFLTGAVWSRDCSLSIIDAIREDTDLYLFRLEDTVKFNYLDIQPYVTVTELKDEPDISVVSLVAGEEVTLTCTSPGRCTGSAPLITWQGVHGKYVNFSSSYSDGNRTYFSNITFTPSKNDKTSSLTCIVNFQKSYVTTKKTITLNVQYPPSINISIEDADINENISLIVNEGDSKTMWCIVDSNPLANISWSVEGQKKRGPVSGQKLNYELVNIGLSDAGRYSCSAWNVYGNINRTAEIIVHYAPRSPKINCLTGCTIPENNITYSLEGSYLSLLCSAKSLPASNLFWIKSDQPDSQALFTERLKFPNVSLSDEGLYTCQANNTLGRSQSSVTIKVSYKPRVVAGDNSSCHEIENRLECTCKVQSIPEANMQWKIDEKLYSSDYNDKDFKISTLKLNAVTNSNLTLKINQRNIQNIHCISSNVYGVLILLLLNNTQSTVNTQTIAAVCGVISIAVVLVTSFFLIKYFRTKKFIQKPEDKKVFSVDDGNAIYSNSEIFSNGAHKPHQIAQTYPETAQDEGSVYMNCDDVQYVSINFAKLKPKNVPEETETEYAQVKHK